MFLQDFEPMCGSGGPSNTPICGSGSAPGAIRKRDPCSRDPPGLPQELPRTPRTALGTPRIAQGPSRARSNPSSQHAQNLRNPCILTRGHIKKRSRRICSRSQSSPETPPNDHPHSQDPLEDPKSVPGSTRGPSKGAQGPPRAPL